MSSGSLLFVTPMPRTNPAMRKHRTPRMAALEGLMREVFHARPSPSRHVRASRPRSTSCPSRSAVCTTADTPPRCRQRIEPSLAYRRHDTGRADPRVASTSVPSAGHRRRFRRGRSRLGDASERRTLSPRSRALRDRSARAPAHTMRQKRITGWESVATSRSRTRCRTGPA